MHPVRIKIGRRLFANHFLLTGARLLGANDAAPAIPKRRKFLRLISSYRDS